MNLDELSPENIEIIKKYQSIHNRLIEIESSIDDLRVQSEFLMRQLRELRQKENELRNTKNNG